jgi:hypothetical protein
MSSEVRMDVAEIVFYALLCRLSAALALGDVLAAANQ